MVAGEGVGDSTPPVPQVPVKEKPSVKRAWQLTALWLIVVLPPALVINLSFRTAILVVLAGVYIGLISYLGALLYHAR